MPLNGKFTEKYGKSWQSMDEGERQMALMSELFDLRESVEPVKGLCESVDKHRTYFKGIWIMIASIGIPVLLMIISTIIDYLKHIPPVVH